MKISIDKIGEKIQDYTKLNFLSELKRIIDEFITPNYGNNLFMSIDLGNFTSGEYGSYKISFKKNETEVCYIIADVIFGKYKLYETTY
jgi:hypothetical protein